MKYIKEDLDCNWNELNETNKGETMEKTAETEKTDKKMATTLPTINDKVPHIKKHQTEIFEYIRRRHHGKMHKVGVVLGILDGKTVRIGWSKCNLSLDKFDTNKGLELAKERAKLTEASVGIPAPDYIRTQLRQFGSRCCRYFKGANRIELPV